MKITISYIRPDHEKQNYIRLIVHKDSYLSAKASVGLMTSLGFQLESFHLEENKEVTHMRKLELRRYNVFEKNLLVAPAKVLRYHYEPCK